ncbi:MAG: pyruvate kinase [Dethiobacteria bacterium]|nr:pyruvate kinase [Bacillota bacterium]MDW7729144.1 pyruvate kinase [Bacillota bacterium]
MRRTKIVCTIGPSIDTEERIEALIDAGMDVARLNLSHGIREDHLRRLEMIRAVASRKRKNVGILFDTRGPEVRTGDLAEEAVFLEGGHEFILTTDQIIGTKERVSVTYPDLHNDIAVGCTILIDDGLISLEVIEIRGQDIVCRVLHGGELRSYKGLNTPGTRINLPAVGEEDEIDIKLALDNEVSFLAASFTRSAEDILEVRRLVENYGGNIMILAKIESREGVENYDSILEVSDGVMVARGDLGVEIPPEEVPLLQKSFIRKCNLAGKPVITATQMLDSMIRNPRPTRAEASDVANAIFDGTDAVMLSGETAMGRFPIEAAETMSRIAVKTEEGLDYAGILVKMSPTIKKTVTDAISYATSHIAAELGADAIITATQSGQTARMVSKYKPKAPIIAVSARRQVANQLTLTWGVNAIVCPPVSSTDDMFANAIQAALKDDMIEEGNLVVITAGVPVGVSGTTNLLRVETVGEVIVKGTGVGKKAASGEAFIVNNDKDLEYFEEGQVLVTRSTGIDYLPAIKKAAALITEEGGLTSHAAIVAINLGKPAVVGVEKAVTLINGGEMITVDAIRGLIYRGKANVL